jgi:ABC-type branched-subunit amino acid transport system substrate-binding protein
VNRTRKKRRTAVLVAATAAALATALLTPAASGAAPSAAVTATDGTIKVAGMGNASSFGDGAVGAAARFERANEDKEVKGYTVEYADALADDKTDPAIALTEARRLVTQEQIFALVPDLSVVTPGDYLTQQQIPWFGPGYDNTYCPESGTMGWGFGTYGCLIRTDAKKLPNTIGQQVKKELAAQGIDEPTIAMIGTDTETGKQSIANSASTYTGVGFEVVYAKGTVPAPPAVVGDFTPYAQALMTSDAGGPPSVIYSTIAVQGGALTLFNLLKEQGFQGVFLTPFYSDLLLKALQGSYVFLQFSSYESDTEAVQEMLADVEAYKPGTKPSLTLAGGYFAADMFIEAVKASLKKSKTLTSASVQQAASKMTYEIKGTIGPTKYPDSYQYSVSSCSTLLKDEDGTAFTIAQPYTCSNKTYPILPKFSREA